MDFKEYTPSENWNKNISIEENDKRFNSFIDFYLNNNLNSDNEYLQKILDEFREKKESNNESETTSSSNFWDLQQKARTKYINRFMPSIRTKKTNMDLSKDINETASTIIDYFIDNGYTKEQAAGIAGNLMQESSFNTGVLGDSGASYGLAQWNKDRRENLKNFASSSGREKSNLLTQLDFIIHELNTSEKRANQKLRETQTVEEATEAFSKWYERPGTPHLDRRLNYARQFYNS